MERSLIYDSSVTSSATMNEPSEGSKSLCASVGPSSSLSADADSSMNVSIQFLSVCSRKWKIESRTSALSGYCVPIFGIEIRMQGNHSGAEMEFECLWLLGRYQDVAARRGGDRDSTKVNDQTRSLDEINIGLMRKNEMRTYSERVDCCKPPGIIVSVWFARDRK